MSDRRATSQGKCDGCFPRRHPSEEDGARPIIYHWQGATCWRPEVKGLAITVDSAAEGWRWEDVWIDR